MRRIQQQWRTGLVVIGVALGWLGVAFVVLPLLGDPVSFNKVSNAASRDLVQASNQVPLRNFRGNVYHIIFDAYQSEAYQYLLDKTPELNQIPLTYYPNFRVNSPRTYLSLADLFASDFYTPNVSPEVWHNSAFQTGMLDYLAKGGVKLYLYPHYPENCYGGGSTVCEITDNLVKGLLGEGQARQTVLDLWFLKLIPGSLKRELNARFAPKDDSTKDTSDDDSFSDWDYGFSISNAIAPSTMPLDSERPYFSLQQFLRVLDDESSRPATGQYIFWHVILPHGPFVLDRECAYIGRIAEAERTPQADQVRYLEQAQCANKLMTLLMNKLASLGRLDDALIIIQADHGNYFHPADLGVLYPYDPLDISVPRVDSVKDDSSTWSSEIIEVKASALLLVKFPGQSTASRSGKPVQMIDIAPTILRYFGIEPPRSMLGIPVQDMPASPARDRLFFAANSIPDPHNPKVLSRYRYVDGRWKFEEDITTFSEANQLFTVNSTGH